MNKVENEIEWDEEQKTKAETENEIVCEEWKKNLKPFNLSENISFENFTKLDADIEVCWQWIDNKIIFQ